MFCTSFLQEKGLGSGGSFNIVPEPFLKTYQNHPFWKQMPDTITIPELPCPQLVRLLSSKDGQLCNNTNLKVKQYKAFQP